MSQLSKRVLGEFFDIVKRYGEPELRVKDRPGRPWSADELRLKSNTDLHKLWYVLLKERNMLLTMKNLREQRAQKFANPERLDKVKESMENLESIIHERNDAVLRLETGDSASPPMRTVTSFAGFTYQKQAAENYKPFEVTKTKEYEVPFLDDDQYLVQKLWNEKQEMKRRLKVHDQYLQKLMNKDHRTFRYGTRKVFNSMDQLPESVLKKAENAS